MKEENIDNLFTDLEGSFDIANPTEGHELRFLQKLNSQSDGLTILTKKRSWFRPLSIAASIIIICSLGAGFIFNNTQSKQKQVAEISPEISQSQFYFASLINEQVKQLEAESTPETKRIVDDTLFQLQKLELNYKTLEQDLLNGGNSKLILSAMITNFQTRIDLLQEVLEKIESIKNLNNYNDENFTI